jgi:hypothetical protein
MFRLKSFYCNGCQPFELSSCIPTSVFAELLNSVIAVHRKAAVFVRRQQNNTYVSAQLSGTCYI